MKFTSRSYLGCLIFGLMVLMAATCHATDDDNSLEIIQFKAPDGWKSSGQAGQPAKLFISPDSTATQQTVILVMLTPAQANLDLRAGFDAMAKQMTKNGKVLKSKDLTSAKTRQGFDCLSQTLVADAGGRKVYVKIVAANVQNRMATFCYMATSSDLFDRRQPDMDAFLKSVSFNIADAKIPGPPAAAIAEYQALENQKQELLKKVAEIEARQRQLGVQAGTDSGHAAEGVPTGDEDKLFARAVDQFAAGVDHRRKPHTVLGEILTFDGKPIPNVVVCNVTVGGTTIAAERTNYTLDVDKNGHFELQIPDGLYKVNAFCSITLNGRRIPVDLVAIDGKPGSVDQASATGIVKDFRLGMTVLKPGLDPKDSDSFCGGVVSINDMTYTPRTGEICTRHPNTRIRFTFTPICNLIDGSKIDPFTIELAMKDFGAGRKLKRIPIGNYRLSVGLVAADGTVTSLTCSLAFDRDFGQAVEVNWEAMHNYMYQRNEPQIYIMD